MSTLPTRTTNITGFRTMCRGIELVRPRPRAARRTMGGWKSGCFTAAMARRGLPACMRKCSTIGPSDRAGKKVSAPTIRMTPISSTTKSGVVTGKVPAVAGAILRSDEEAGERHHRDDHGEAADQHRERRAGCCSSRWMPVSPAKALPLLPGGRAERVQDLGQSVRAGVVEALQPAPASTDDSADSTRITAREDRARRASPSGPRAPGSACPGTRACGPP